MTKKKRKLSCYKITRLLMTLPGILYVPSLYFVPFMKPLKNDILLWLFYIIYILILIVLWKLPGKKSYDYSDIDKKQLQDTVEILKERSKWYL